MDELKDSSYILPYLVGYFIFYGTVTLSAFYSQFHIQILDYVEPSEVVVYLLRDTRLVAFNVIVLAICIVFANKLVPLRVRRNEEQFNLITDQKSQIHERTNQGILDHDELLNEITNSLNELEESASTAKKTMRVTKISFLIIGLVLAVAIWYYHGPLRVVQVLFPLIAATLVYAYVSQKPSTYAFTFLRVSSIVSAYVNGVETAKEVKTGKPYATEFKVNGQLIISDSVNYMIGKTNNYVFYYHSKEQRTSVYPVEKVEFLSLPAK